MNSRDPWRFIVTDRFGGIVIPEARYGHPFYKDVPSWIHYDSPAFGGTARHLFDGAFVAGWPDSTGDNMHTIGAELTALSTPGFGFRSWYQPYYGYPYSGVFLGASPPGTITTRALIQSAIEDVAVAEDPNFSPISGYGFKHWYWVLYPSTEEPFSAVGATSSHNEALAEMRKLRHELRPLALAVFDKTSPHWPNPVAWTKTDDPTYDQAIARRLAKPAKSRSTGFGMPSEYGLVPPSTALPVPPPPPPPEVGITPGTPPTSMTEPPPRRGLTAELAPILAPATGGVTVEKRLDDRQVLHVKICVDGKCYSASMDLAPAIVMVMEKLSRVHDTYHAPKPPPATVVSTVETAVGMAEEAIVGALLSRHVETISAGILGDIAGAVKGAVTGAARGVAGTFRRLKGPIGAAAGIAAAAGASAIPGVGVLAAPLAAKLANDLVQAASGDSSAQQAVAQATRQAKTNPATAAALDQATKAVANSTAAYHVEDTAKKAARGDAAAQREIVQVAEDAESGDPAAKAVADLIARAMKSEWGAKLWQQTTGRGPDVISGWPWYDVTTVGQWHNIVGADPDTQARALIQSAIRDAQWSHARVIENHRASGADARGVPPPPAYVWKLVAAQEEEGGPPSYSNMNFFSSRDEALNYARQMNQVPDIVATAVFEPASRHWPNPVTWHQSRNPGHQWAVDRQLSGVHATESGTTVGQWQQTKQQLMADANAFLQEVRPQITTQSVVDQYSLVLSSDVSPAVRLWWEFSVTPFFNGLSDWQQSSDESNSQVWIDKLAALRGEASSLGLSVTSPAGTAASGWHSLVGAALENVEVLRETARTHANTKRGKAAGVIMYPDGTLHGRGLGSLDRAIDWLQHATRNRRAFVYAAAYEKASDGTAIIQDEEFGEALPTTPTPSPIPRSAPATVG